MTKETLRKCYNCIHFYVPPVPVCNECLKHGYSFFDTNEANKCNDYKEVEDD